MPQGDKRHYTEKQKRQARHIEASFKKRYPRKDAEGRAWAVVNAIHGGGELPGGGGYGKAEDKSVYRKGGRRGGKAGAQPRRKRPSRKR